MRVPVVALALVFSAAPALAETPPEHERLRADMEGQVERMRLELETWMAEERGLGRLAMGGCLALALAALAAARSARAEARAARKELARVRGGE